MISVDQSYERKMAGNYNVKANAYQEYCIEVIGGIDTTPMASWRVYKRYSAMRKYYKQIVKTLTKNEAKAIQFPGKKIQFLGSHINTKALEERERMMMTFVNEVMSKEPILHQAETKVFLTQDTVNVKYEV